MQDGLARQLRLWEEVTAPSSNGQDFGDPAFAANKSRPIHRWVPWIAGFSGEFVKNALRRYLDRPGLVLDPFAGVGTTLVEALLLGHQAVGFEINPYAALACRVKTTAYAIAPEKLYSEMARFQDFYHSRVGIGQHRCAPVHPCRQQHHSGRRPGGKSPDDRPVIRSRC